MYIYLKFVFGLNIKLESNREFRYIYFSLFMLKCILIL